MNWSSTDELWLATLWENGQSLRAISRAMEGKYSPSAVSGKSWRMGLAKRGSPIGKRRTPRIVPCKICGASFDRVHMSVVRCVPCRRKPMPRERVIALRKWGLTIHQIAKEIGRHPDSVYKVLVKAGMGARVPKGYQVHAPQGHVPHTVPERSAA
jgi:lambda repressor-like predicted transcriptional regulator